MELNQGVLERLRGAGIDELLARNPTLPVRRNSLTTPRRNST
jgi:hypothetical protein